MTTTGAEWVALGEAKMNKKNLKKIVNILAEIKTNTLDRYSS